MTGGARVLAAASGGARKPDRLQRGGATGDLALKLRESDRTSGGRPS
jgi:hypothetical protein